MVREQFTEAQVALALRHAEAGTSVAEIMWRLGVNEQNW